MILIATLAYLLAQRAEGVTSAIPILGALALGAQRLLPVMQIAYQSWTGMRGAQSSLQDAIELLNQPLPEYADKPTALPMPFKHNINIKQIDFRYTPEAPRVLKKINFTIERGSIVGFIGPTGSGKSTLLDIIMGLLEPTDGTIEIDGSVGPVGGIKQKVIAAKRIGAELILVPTSNFNEVAELSDSNTSIIAISSFQDSLSVIKEFTSS